MEDYARVKMLAATIANFLMGSIASASQIGEACMQTYGVICCVFVLNVSAAEYTPS